MTKRHSNTNNPFVIASAALAAVPPAALRLPPHLLKRLPAHLLERCVDLAEMNVALYRDAISKQALNRARVQECIDTYACLRGDILSFLGADSKCEDLMPLPVLLQDH
jgi:hypothetical protein